MKLLLVDRSSIFRMGMKAALAAAPEAADLEVVGECEDGATASAMAVALGPDVVVSDLDLGDRNGIALARQCGHKAPAVRVLILTSYGPEAIVHQALGAGAGGYALKRQPPAEIIAAIRSVGRGELVLPAGVAAPPPRVVGAGVGKNGGTQGIERLSQRERQIFDLGDLGELQQADRRAARHQHQDGRDPPRPHQRQAARPHQRRHRPARLAVGPLPGRAQSDDRAGSRPGSDVRQQRDVAAVAATRRCCPPTFLASVWRVMPRCWAASVRLPPQISSTRRMCASSTSSSVGMAAPTSPAAGRRPAPPAPRRPARPGGARGAARSSSWRRSARAITARSSRTLPGQR